MAPRRPTILGTVHRTYSASPPVGGRSSRSRRLSLGYTRAPCPTSSAPCSLHHARLALHCGAPRRVALPASISRRIVGRDGGLDSGRIPASALSLFWIYHVHWILTQIMYSFFKKAFSELLWHTFSLGGRLGVKSKYIWLYLMYRVLVSPDGWYRMYVGV